MPANAAHALATSRAASFTPASNVAPRVPRLETACATNAAYASWNSPSAESAASAGTSSPPEKSICTFVAACSTAAAASDTRDTGVPPGTSTGTSRAAISAVIALWRAKPRSRLERVASFPIARDVTAGEGTRAGASDGASGRGPDR